MKKYFTINKEKGETLPIGWLVIFVILLLTALILF